jgi:hypothetical protein
MDHE